jgi:predicted dehydrogenase
MDLGCYAIWLVRFLANAEPEVVSTQAQTTSPQLDRWMRADLRFPGDVTGSFTSPSGRAN